MGRPHRQPPDQTTAPCARFKQEVRSLIDKGGVRTWHTHEELWVPNKDFTTKWTQVRDNEEMGCGKSKETMQWVKVSANFAEILEATDERKGAQKATRSPTLSLMYLIGKIILFHREIFEHTSRLGIQKILGRNNWIMEQAFVAMIIAVSRRLGEERYPCGVHYWPPKREARKARSPCTGGAASCSGLDDAERARGIAQEKKHSKT